MTAITDNIASSNLLSSVNTRKAAAGAAAGAAPGSEAATQDRFLKLLVTQMKNQDPMNPLDNAAVTSQLAQLSTVSGIEKLNTTMQSLEQSFQFGQAVQATALIGHNVLVPGNNLTLSSGAAGMGLDLPSAADKVSVSILDAAGHVIKKIDMGPQAPGMLPLTWDGKTDKGTAAPDGKYTFAITASNGETAVKPVSLAYDRVSSVSTGATGTKLNLGSGQALMSDVRQIL